MNKNSNLLSYVADLYYERGLSQKEISSIIGASRPTVSRLIEDAKRQGVVEIRINTPITQNPKLSNKIRKLFNLHDAIVVNGDYDFNKSIINCGKAASTIISTYLHDNESIGITWGRAISSFADAVEPEIFENIHVAQMVGCISANNPNIDSFSVAQRLAKKMNGSFSTINSPLFVSTAEVYEYLLKEPIIKRSLDIASNVNVCINGIASTSDNADTIKKAGYSNFYDLKSFADKGAVGNILGRYIDINGNEIKSNSLHSVSVPLDTLKKAKYSLLISASAEKALATFAALNGKLANILICDEELAKELIRLKTNKEA